MLASKKKQELNALILIVKNHEKNFNELEYSNFQWKERKSVTSRYLTAISTYKYFMHFYFVHLKLSKYIYFYIFIYFTNNQHLLNDKSKTYTKKRLI